MTFESALILTLLAVLAPPVVFGLWLIAQEWPKDRDPVSRGLLAIIAILLVVAAFWLTQFPGSPLLIIKY
jgi:hypothetical protein